MGCGASSGTNLVQHNRPTCTISVQTDPYVIPHVADTTGATPTTSKAAPAAGGHHGRGKNMPEGEIDIEDTWLKVCDTLDVPKGKKSSQDKLVVKRTGWKTIRVFVSSTFKDFHHEREVLVKEVSL